MGEEGGGEGGGRKERGEEERGRGERERVKGKGEGELKGRGEVKGILFFCLSLFFKLHKTISSPQLSLLPLLKVEERTDAYTHSGTASSQN